MKPEVKAYLQDAVVSNGQLYLQFTIKNCIYDKKVRSPRVSLYFQSESWERIVPIPVTRYDREEGTDMAILTAAQGYLLSCLFRIGKTEKKFRFSLSLQYGENEWEGIPICLPETIRSTQLRLSYVGDDVQLMESGVRRQEAEQVTVDWSGVSDSEISVRDMGQNNVETEGVVKREKEPLASKVNRHLFRLFYKICFRLPVRQGKVFFLSNRRNDMTGNMEYVYQELNRGQDKLHMVTLLKNSDMRQWHPFYFLRAAYHAATSVMILVDDSCNFLDFVDLKPQTSLMQLWHACGAFKTFGYSRLGKVEGPSQKDRNHRFYTYAIVSSKEISRFYAEGFGIPLSHVYATGVPRTDLFFDQSHARKVSEAFYRKYPQLRQKKIILFAPTFRGWDKENAYYPMDKFNPVRFLEQVGGEYVLLIKHHPYVKDTWKIPEKFQDRILDMTWESEINDLLFVSDLVITDYSSVIFEASLLDLPMLFYAFDLEEYISARDFYYEYESFVPGKIVRGQQELIRAVRQKDFEQEKVAAFRKRFFDHLDGRSAARVADLVRKDVEEKRKEKG